MTRMHQLLKELDKYLIGLWRFREAGKPRKWCATYCFDGDYYDVGGASTPEAALEKVSKNLKRMIAGRK